MNLGSAPLQDDQRFIAKIKKYLSALPDDELVKWRDETDNEVMKKCIKDEMDLRFWNDKTDIQPWI